MKLVFNYLDSQLIQDQMGVWSAVLKQVNRVLPENIKSHDLHFLVSNKTLLIYTDSASRASQLRFFADKLLAIAKEEGFPALTTVRIKVGQNYQPLVKRRQANVPSAETIELLATNGQAHVDPQLRAALTKLSTTLLRLRHDNNTQA